MAVRRYSFGLALRLVTALAALVLIEVVAFEHVAHRQTSLTTEAPARPPPHPHLMPTAATSTVYRALPIRTETSRPTAAPPSPLHSLRNATDRRSTRLR